MIMTIMGSRQLRLILAAITISLPSCLFAQTKSQHTAKEVRVPFVGCASDGQAGPLAAPKGGDRVVQINAKAAQQLAYYQAERGLGVLAPRGWHCFGTYGSSGGALYVSPLPYTSADFFSDKWNGFTGPAIQASVMSGGTSGRFEVARVAARVFPAEKAFVKRVIGEGLWPASDFPFGPFPKDKLTYHGDRIVEYQTPPHAEGLGTMSWLRANDYPIKGIEIFQGEEQEAYLTGLAVRLPPALNDLTSPIIRQIELDCAADASNK
jgi:hypothetical protein